MTFRGDGSRRQGELKDGADGFHRCINWMRPTLQFTTVRHEAKERGVTGSNNNGGD
jgi:hypothetical protein